MTAILNNLTDSDLSIGSLCSLDLMKKHQENNLLNLLLPKNYLQHSLADLNAVKSGFFAYLLVLNIFEDALENFIQHKYRMFDALVGNNSCYLVAYIIFILSKKIDKNECRKFLEEIKELKFSVFRKYNELHLNYLDPSLKFQDYLIENKLVLANINIDYIYLCLAFACALTKEKNVDEYEEINEDLLIKIYRDSIEMEVKKKSVLKLLKHWQKIISHINIGTIQEHVKLLPNNGGGWARYLFSPYILKDGRERLCTPSLYAQMIIYESLIKVPKTLFGLQVNIIEQPKQYKTRFTIYYEVQFNGELKILSEEELSPNNAIFMFSGCRYILPNSFESLAAVKDSFAKRDLKDLIFAHEVTYPQYPKSLKAKNILPEEPLLLEKIRQLKKFQGFSLEDPSDLCLVHIFVDNTSTQLLAIHEPPVYLPALCNNCS